MAEFRASMEEKDRSVAMFDKRLSQRFRNSFPAAPTPTSTAQILVWGTGLQQRVGGGKGRSPDRASDSLGPPNQTQTRKTGRSAVEGGRRAVGGSARPPEHGGGPPRAAGPVGQGGGGADDERREPAGEPGDGAGPRRGGPPAGLPPPVPARGVLLHRRREGGDAGGGAAARRPADGRVPVDGEGGGALAVAGRVPGDGAGPGPGLQRPRLRHRRWRAGERLPQGPPL